MISEFKSVYADNEEAQRERYAFLAENFKSYFSLESDEGIEYFSAPGRTEIGGETTLTTSTAEFWRRQLISTSLRRLKSVTTA